MIKAPIAPRVRETFLPFARPDIADEVREVSNAGEAAIDLGYLQRRMNRLAEAALCHCR